jgi:hypothetical protein
MTLTQSHPPLTLPDHTQLPESDGTFVKNFQEHPQSILLTTSIWPVLEQLHPDGQFCIGQDSGIYWQPGPSLSNFIPMDNFASVKILEFIGN